MWLRWYSIYWLIKTFKETKIEGLQAALFSEDYPTLKDRHVGKLEIEVPEWLGRVKEDKAYGLCVKLDPAFGGGVLLLRNLDDPSKYMSSEFGLVAVDELTKNPPDVFHNLRARIRWPGLGRQTKFIAGTNPGNIGHEWVKKIWIDKVFDKNEQEIEEFAYVPATVTDNPYIDESYVKSLESLPERMMKALREGSWDITAGMYFPEFDRERHVVEDIPIEERDPLEVTHGFGIPTAPEGTKVYSPAFDVTPYSLVTAIITDKGVFYAPYDNLKDKILDSK